MKRRKMEIPLEVLSDMLTGKLFSRPIISTTAPEDLSVIGVEMTFEQKLNGLFTVFLESNVFSDVQEGELTPSISPFKYTVGPMENA